MLTTVFIVQSRESGLFLCPHENGDVGLCMYVNEAGHFYSVDDATETALDEIGEGFIVFSFLLNVKDF